MDGGLSKPRPRVQRATGPRLLRDHHHHHHGEDGSLRGLCIREIDVESQILVTEYYSKLRSQSITVGPVYNTAQTEISINGLCSNFIRLARSSNNVSSRLSTIISARTDITLRFIFVSSVDFM